MNRVWNGCISDGVFYTIALILVGNTLFESTFFIDHLVQCFSSWSDLSVDCRVQYVDTWSAFFWTPEPPCDIEIKLPVYFHVVSQLDGYLESPRVWPNNMGSNFRDAHDLLGSRGQKFGPEEKSPRVFYSKSNPTRCERGLPFYQVYCRNFSVWTKEHLRSSSATRRGTSTGQSLC